VAASHSSGCSGPSRLEFVTRMGGKSVMLHELIGNLLRQL